MALTVSGHKCQHYSGSGQTRWSAGCPSKLGAVTPPPLVQRIALGLMHPTQVATPFHRPGWVYEEKVDGYRMAAMKTDDGARLISRNGIHLSNRFPALVQALTALSAAPFLLDGETAIYDQALVSRFEWMRARPKDALATEPVPKAERAGLRVATW